MRDFSRSVLDEPRAPGAPPRSRWDWMLAAVMGVVTLIGALLADEVEWRAVEIALTVPLPLALLWRRSHPLAAVGVVFGVLGTVNVVSQIVAETAIGFASAALTGLVLTYALLRWASGRDAAAGLAIVVGSFIVTDALDPSVDAIGSAVGTMIFLFSAALGATMRFRSTAALRSVEQARLREREQLARELHDTVAHHVSAIAIQAQAGRMLSSSQPDAANAALVVIEEAASRTLTEMRKMVSALRSDDAPESMPQRCLADIEKLAEPGVRGHRVEVELDGVLDDLSPSMQAGLYRIAQESVTNSKRHARHATRVSVQIHGDHDSVRMTVTDDGDPVGRETGSPSGFGLVGMTERATLLGGDLRAGPGEDRGWVVRTELPRDRARS